MDQEYKPILSEEERAARRAQRAASRRKKQRERRLRLLRRLIPCLLLALLAGGLLTAGANLISKPEAEPAKAVRPAHLADDAASSLPEPYARAVPNADTVQLGAELSSTHAVVIDLETRSVLAEKDPDAVISPASMTKILTALVAAEHITEADLDQAFTMTIDITDYCYVNGCSVVGLMVGETVSVRELFYGTILPSGADAALGLATYVAGSQEAFVALMNEKLEELGIADTAHFTNCVGLFDENHKCTVSDMAVILEAAMDNDLCREVLGARTYETAPTTDHPEGQILSNWFLRRIEDKDTGGITVTGAKTGYVVESGNCAASYGEAADGHRYICVTADAASSWQAIYDHAALYKAYCSPDAAAEDDGDGAADALAEPVPPTIKKGTTEHESGASR